MTKRTQMNNIIAFKVRWNHDGKAHEKTYPSETKAIQAKEWLLSNNIKSVDIAVVLREKSEQ